MKKFSLIFITIIIQLIGQNTNADNNNNYLDYNDEIDDSSLNSLDTDDNVDEYDETENQCSVDTMFDKFSELITPDDYEEGKTVEIRKQVDHINETAAIVRRLMNYGKNISEKLGPLMKRVMPRIIDILLTVDLPADCFASFARIAQSAEKGEYWAIRFLDTMTIPGSGQLTAMMPLFGPYDQCVNIKSLPKADDDKPVIFGRYCLVSPVLPLPSRVSYNQQEPMDSYLDVTLGNLIATSNDSARQSFWGQFYSSEGKFRIPPNIIETVLDMHDKNEKVGLTAVGFGVCLPSTCDINDIENAINKFAYPMTRIPVKIKEETCDYKDKPIKLDKYQIIALLTYSALLILVMVSTIYDSIRKYCATLQPTLITDSFSLINNCKLLIPKKSVEGEENRFSFLDGIRTVLTLWVFVTHLWIFNIMSVFTSKGMFTAWKRFVTETKYTFLRHLFITQIYMLIAGMFTSYIMLVKLNKGSGRFNYIHYILYRYLRTIPAMVGTIFLIYIMPLTGDGPIWSGYLDGFLQSCKYNWNASLLMISNYKFQLPNRLICNPPSWYTSTDFQAYSLAPFIFLFLYHKPRFGLILNVLVIVLSCFAQMAPKVLFNIAHYHETAAFRNVDHGFTSIVHHFYGLEQHIGVYSIGLLLGYIILNKSDIYLGGRIGECVIWCVTSTMFFLSFVWHRNFFRFDTEISNVELLFYMAFERYLAVAFWVWVLFACSTGRGGFVNKFFSLRAFKFFGAISVELYLLHSLPMLYRISSMREQVIVTDYYLLSLVPFDLIITCLLSVALNLLVTSPFKHLVDSVFKPRKSSDKTSYNLNNEKLDLDNNNEFPLTAIQSNTTVDQKNC